SEGIRTLKPLLQWDSGGSAIGLLGGIALRNALCVAFGFSKAAVKSRVLASLPAPTFSFLGLTFLVEGLRLSAKNILTTATVLLKWLKVLIFAPTNFSLT